MTRIRVAFRYGDSRPFARVVTLLRGGDSAHCEAAWSWEGERHRCVSSSFLDGGVRGKDINMPVSKWRIYEIDALRDPLEWCAQNSGAGYDVLGLLGIIFPPIGHARRRWFCSEVVAHLIGLNQPHTFDLRMLEVVCARFGTRVQ